MNVFRAIASYLEDESDGSHLGKRRADKDLGNGWLRQTTGARKRTEKKDFNLADTHVFLRDTHKTMDRIDEMTEQQPLVLVCGIRVTCTGVGV